VFILAVFILSLLQFSFSLSAKKERNLKLVGFKKAIDLIFATEAWTLVLLLLSQDLPCFIIRIYILTTLKAENEFSLLFFTIKNGLMIPLELIRIYIVIRKQLKKEAKISITNISQFY
jgi:hypothetical protein